MNNAKENIFDKKDCKQTESNRIKLSLLQQIENVKKKKNAGDDTLKLTQSIRIKLSRLLQIETDQ